MIRILMRRAIHLGIRTDDPTRDVEKYSVSTDGYHTWDEGEIARFYELHKPGTVAHTAMTLMLFTGAARVDACALGWQKVRDGRIQYRRQKTKGQNGVLVDIPIHPDLLVVLEALPRDRMTFLQTTLHKARSPNGLGNLMRTWCDDAGLSNCTSHGLRKACARRLAEAGASTHEIGAVTGHLSLKEVDRYTRAANRSGLADSGFEKLVARAKSEQTLANHPDRFVNKSRNKLKNRG